MKKLTSLLLLLVSILTALAGAAPEKWQPVPGKMMTRWGQQVRPDRAWPEYPRPQFERKAWQNLNGLWDYAINTNEAAKPTAWAGKILVPFSIESTLSGVGKELKPEEVLWYHRVVTLQPHADRRTLLNFEAADYQTTVWLNGQLVGIHTGGNTPFQFDLTPALQAGANELVIRILDATGDTQLCGKQSLRPGGCFYTRVSGIWQTVWLEEVPALHLTDLKITTAINPATIRIVPEFVGATTATVRVTATFQGVRVAHAEGPANAEIKLPIPRARLWSPAQPHLYDLRIELLDAAGKVTDTVRSYAGLREITRQRDAAGHWRFRLNGAEVFCFGPLDQGWWPDGLLTPPTDAAMRADVDFLKAAGFNTIRKHVKVEPRRYYTYCDQVGMLLWQDQVSATPGKKADGSPTSPPWTRLEPNPQDAAWTDAEHAQWQAELAAMVDELRNHPAIIVWVPFNEAWGQHRSLEVGAWLAAHDPTRLINLASGGNFWPVGHIADYHEYPNPEFPLGQERLNDYIKVVGEFGGHGWPEPGHLWNEKKRNWGYGGLPQTKEELVARYTKSLDVLTELKAQGIAAGIYTQTTDVEGEINGLMTYDRAVAKIPAKKLAALHQQLGPEIRR